MGVRTQFVGCTIVVDVLGTVTALMVVANRVGAWMMVAVTSFVTEDVGIARQLQADDRMALAV